MSSVVKYKRSLIILLLRKLHSYERRINSWRLRLDLSHSDCKYRANHEVQLYPLPVVYLDELLVINREGLDSIRILVNTWEFKNERRKRDRVGLY